MKPKHPWFGCSAVTTSYRLAILYAVVSGILNSGCLVVSSNHVSKPIAPRETVELRHEENGGDATGWYVCHVHSTGVDLDISVRNNAERLQIGFLFWVLPVPSYVKTSVPDAEIEAALWPNANSLVVDPWRIEFVPTNGAPIAPARIKRLLETNFAWATIDKQTGIFQARI